VLYGLPDGTGARDAEGSLGTARVVICPRALCVLVDQNRALTPCFTHFVGRQTKIFGCKML
jgi:hypothetical protein